MGHRPGAFLWAGLPDGWVVKPTGLIPPQLLGSLQFPVNVVNSIPIIRLIAGFISSLTDLGAIACFFVVMVLILTGVATTLYAATYRWVGPARLLPRGCPPDRYKWGRKPRKADPPDRSRSIHLQDPQRYENCPFCNRPIDSPHGRSRKGHR